MTDRAEHQARMERIKSAVDQRVAAAQEEKGLLIVHTGAGKGKTTAALGMALRCLGHGWRVAMVQFIKGAIDTAEERALKSFGEQVAFHRVGEGFTWVTQDRERDIHCAEQGWEQAKEYLHNQEYAMVILDELNIALHHDYLSISKILADLEARPPMQHVVITGRGAKQELMDAADLVTDMRLIKHPFRQGIKAQPGVEF